MAAELGWVGLGVAPDFTGFKAKSELEARKALGVAGGTASAAFGSRFRSGIKKLGLFTGLGAGLGVGSIIKDSVELEAQFSKTMGQIRVATEAPADQLKRLDDLAVTLGKDTMFSASDASEAMLELAKNGIKPATIEAGALKSAMTLAAAGGLDMGQAATTMGNALNAFGLKGKDSEKVAAALAGAANASSASVGSLAEGLQQASAVADDAGFTVQETTGALAAFANAGIDGSDAGTSLKTAISRLVPMTAKARGVMQKYGLVTYDANKAQKVLAQEGIKASGKSYTDTYKAVSKYLAQQGVAEEGTAKLAKATEDYLNVTGIMRNDFLKANGDFKDLADVAGELDEAFAGLSDSQRAEAMNTLFGSDAKRAATVLMKEGKKGIEDYVKATEDTEQAEKLAKANMEGTAGAIEKLKGSWETAKLELGKALAPVAQKALDALSGSIDDIGPKLSGWVDWLVDHGDEIKAFGGKVKDVAGFVGDLAGWLNDLPKTVKIGGLGAVAALVGGMKLRGGSKGILGTAGKALGLAKPIPVFVTNPGFGAGTPGPPGTPPVTPAPTTKGQKLKRGLRSGAKWLPLLPIAYETLFGDLFGTLPQPKVKPSGGGFNRSGGHVTGAFGVGLGPQPGDRGTGPLHLGKFDDDVKQAIEDVDRLDRKASALGPYRAGLEIPKLNPLFDRVQQFGSILDGLDGRHIQIYVDSKYNGPAGGLGAPNRSGTDSGEPSARFGGTTHNYIHNGNVVAPNPREYDTWRKNKKRAHSGGGR